MTGTKWGATRGRYAGCLQGRIEAFYGANPGAALLKAEACERFGCTPAQWRDAVARLRSSGVLRLEAVPAFRVVPHETTAAGGPP